MGRIWRTVVRSGRFRAALDVVRCWLGWHDWSTVCRSRSAGRPVTLVECPRCRLRGLLPDPSRPGDRLIAGSTFRDDR